VIPICATWNAIAAAAGQPTSSAGNETPVAATMLWASGSIRSTNRLQISRLIPTNPTPIRIDDLAALLTSTLNSNAIAKMIKGNAASTPSPLTMSLSICAPSSSCDCCNGTGCVTPDISFSRSRAFLIKIAVS
jgi:hypothetical protein